MQKIREIINKIKEAFSTPTEELGKLSRLLVFQVKMWFLCIKLLKKNRASQQAAALTYHTIFGLVPLGIVILLIFQSFPAYKEIGDKIKYAAYDYLQLSNIEYESQNPNIESESDSNSETIDASLQKIAVTQHLDELLDSFFTRSSKGTASIISIVFVIWAAIGLLTTIERTFNNFWNVEQNRNFLKRMINYWALLTLCPLLIGAGIWISTQGYVAGHLNSSWFTHYSKLMPFLVSLAAFFFLYFVIPNIKVHPGCALWGAFIASLVWLVAKWGFQLYIQNAKPYAQLYGIMGLIPLTILWLFFTWKIILFGVQITYTTQNFKTHESAMIAADQKQEDFFIINEVTVLNIMKYIATDFEQGNGPVKIEDIKKHTQLPAKFLQNVLNHLVASSLLCVTTEPAEGYVPGKDPENISLEDIAKSVTSEQLRLPNSDIPNKFKDALEQNRKNIQSLNLKEVLRAEPKPDKSEIV